MTTFPLFHLPLVAIDHVLCMMSPFDLLDLSLTSTKTKKAVKDFAKLKTKFLATLFASSDSPSISISRGLNQRLPVLETWSFTWTTDETKIGHKTEDFGVSHNVTKYSENPIGDLMKWYDYIKEVLGCPFRSIYFNLETFPNQNRLIFDWLCSHQNSFGYMRIYSKDKQQSEDIKYLFNNIRRAEELSLTGDLNEDDFHVEIPEGRNLSIQNARFINYEQLLRLKHQDIFFQYSNLTNQEINQFLKSWIACESHLDLKTIEIPTQSRNIMDFLIDIPNEVTTDPATLLKFYHRFFFTVHQAHSIHRSDGKMGSMIMTRVKDTFSLCLLVD
uniref:F-box domain-containing protein n=1 Tax=Caenorhabditis tropicalis TaxID=1561998 RepID=A0A1I7TH93_9PELO